MDFAGPSDVESSGGARPKIIAGCSSKRPRSLSPTPFPRPKFVSASFLPPNPPPHRSLLDMLSNSPKLGHIPFEHLSNSAKKKQIWSDRGDVDEDLIEFADGARESLGILSTSRMEEFLQIDHALKPASGTAPKLLIPELEGVGRRLFNTGFLAPTSTIPEKILQRHSLNTAFLEARSSVSNDSTSPIFTVSQSEDSCFKYSQFMWDLKSSISSISSMDTGDALNQAVIHNLTDSLKELSMEKEQEVEKEREIDIATESVFIEANYLASRFKDGSFFEESDSGPNVLDGTREPKELHSLPDDDDDEVEDQEPIKKCDKADVYHAIDMLVPDTKSKSEEEPKESVSEKKTPRRSARVDPKLILQDLSEMLKDKIGSESETVMSSLAAILNVSSLKSEDSGHSSTNEEKGQSSEDSNIVGMIICKKSAKTPLADELLKKPHHQSFGAPKLPRKMIRKLPGKSATINNSTKSSCSSADSSRNLSNFSLKGRTGVPKRGPLKATARLAEVSKLKFTPPRSDSSTKSFSKCSTPYTEYTPEPIAQSTPDGVFRAPMPRSIKRASSALPIARAPSPRPSGIPLSPLSNRPLPLRERQLNFSSSHDSSLEKSSLLNKSQKYSPKSFTGSDDSYANTNFRRRAYSTGTAPAPSKYKNSFKARPIPDRNILNGSNKENNKGHN